MNKIEDFIDDCISCGKVISNDLKIPLDIEIKIEDVLMFNSDKKARRKIRNLLNETTQKG